MAQALDWRAAGEGGERAATGPAATPMRTTTRTTTITGTSTTTHDHGARSRPRARLRSDAARGGSSWALRDHRRRSCSSRPASAGGRSSLALVADAGHMLADAAALGARDRRAADRGAVADARAHVRLPARRGARRVRQRHRARRSRRSGSSSRPRALAEPAGRSPAGRMTVTAVARASRVNLGSAAMLGARRARAQRQHARRARPRADRRARLGRARSWRARSCWGSAGTARTR